METLVSQTKYRVSHNHFQEFEIFTGARISVIILMGHFEIKVQKLSFCNKIKDCACYIFMFTKTFPPFIQLPSYNIGRGKKG